MNTKTKADAWNIRSNYPMNYINGANQRLSRLNFSQNKPFGQCQKCDSDYMRFAINNICQKCLQKVEFIVREHPQILNKINHGGNR